MFLNCHDHRLARQEVCICTSCLLVVQTRYNCHNNTTGCALKVAKCKINISLRGLAYKVAMLCNDLNTNLIKMHLPSNSSGTDT